MDVVIDGSRPVVVVLADGMGPVVVVTADELDSVVNPVSFPVWIPADTGKDNTCNIYACQTHYILPPVIKHSPVFKLETGFVNCARACVRACVCVCYKIGGNFKCLYQLNAELRIINVTLFCAKFGLHSYGMSLL